MRFWQNLLGGLIVWAVHFFSVYVIASLLPGTQTARALVLVATAVALVILILQARDACRLRNEGDSFRRWSTSLSLLGLLMAGLAVIYQGLPAALG